MHATVVTLFRDLFTPLLTQSVFGRAARRGLVRVDFVDLREHGEGPHRVVDDRPFGGGPGMVLKAEPVLAAVARAQARHPRGARTIFLTPQGRRLDQALVRDLAASRDLVLLCGRYEGIDERALEILRPEEVSIGDYVLSGGELAAMVLLDAVARLRPGVLGDEASAAQDSFGEGEGLLDHPHYTRPLEVRGLGVPDVLRSGDHGAIARYRHAEALERTRARRPDLLAGGGPSRPGTAPAAPATGPAPCADPPGVGSGGAGARPPRVAPPPPPERPHPFIPDPD